MILPVRLAASPSPAAVLPAAAVEARRVLLPLLLLRQAVDAGPVNAWVPARPRHARATTEVALFVLMLGTVVQRSPIQLPVGVG